MAFRYTLEDLGLPFIFVWCPGASIEGNEEADATITILPDDAKLFATNY